MPNSPRFYSRPARHLRAAWRALVFFLKVFPMLPSRPVDWMTPAPVIEKVRYPTCDGEAEGDLYRPGSAGPHPGVMVCLGVVPFGQDHPQVSVMGKALARAGFAALLHWSPAMRDFRLDPEDLENIPLAYRWLTDQPYVDASRSGMLGTCVGGAFDLMAAASPLIRDRVAFASAYAPYCSMWTFSRDIVCRSVADGDRRVPWKVDQLTLKVFVHSITAWLEPGEAERLRAAFDREDAPGSLAASGNLAGNLAAGNLPAGDLSPEGKAIHALLTARDVDAAEAALRGLPPALQERLNRMSPLTHLENLHTPLIQLMHDRGDQVIPIGESRRLVAALNARGNRVLFTEMNFSHLDPIKGKLPFHHLVGELWKFLHAMYPLFLVTTR